MADSNVKALMVVLITFAALSLVFMGLRFYCKLISVGNKRLAIDDYVLLLSWLLYMAFAIVSLYNTSFGLGEHVAVVMAQNPLNLTKIVKLMAVGNFFAVLSIAVSKTSFILTLLRLVIKPWQHVVLWFMAATILLSMLMIAVVQVFQCPGEPAPGCIDGNIVIRLGVYAASYSAVMDIVLSAFPSLVIWQLQMKQKEKFAVIVAMSLGVIAGIVGIYKSSIIPAVARDTDFTFGIAIVLIWLAAEFTATILAASIPFMRPLLRQVSSSVGIQKFSKQSNAHVRLNSLSKSGGRQADTESNRELVNNKNKIVRRTDFTLEYNDGASPEEGRDGYGEDHHRF